MSKNKKPTKNTKNTKKTKKGNIPFTIASFDIGIKNLAFCVMHYVPSNPLGKRYPIQEWKNIDLTDSDGLSDRFCCALLSFRIGQDT